MKLTPTPITVEQQHSLFVVDALSLLFLLICIAIIVKLTRKVLYST